MRISIEKAAELLSGMNHVTILCHRSPDGDTLGSGYALCRAFRQMGREARVLCSDIPAEKYAFMYEGLDCPDFEEEHVVSVDIADEKLFGEGLSAYCGRVELAVDHHSTHADFAENVCLMGDSASNCEIMCDILKLMGIRFTPDIADCLYTGMATDTGCFKYTNVTAHTLRAAADMIDAGCHHGRICKVFFDTKSYAVIRLEQAVLASLEIYENGKIAVVEITQKMLQNDGLSDSDVEAVVPITRQIEGVVAGVTFKERPTGEHRVSLRTGEEVDASVICRQFGGGGHARAAGCSFPAEVTDYREQILAALRTALNQN